MNGFRGSTFLRLLNNGDRAGCAQAIMSWTKNKELVSRRAAERDQFLTPYSVRAPKARSSDAKPVTAGIYVVEPAVPTSAVTVAPLPQIPAGPLVPPAPRRTVTLPVPADPPAAAPAKPGLLARMADRLRAAFPPKKA